MLEQVFPSPALLFPIPAAASFSPSRLKGLWCLSSEHPPVLHRGQVPSAHPTRWLLLPSHFLQLWQNSCLCNMSPAGGRHVSMHTRSPRPTPAPPCPAQPRCVRHRAAKQNPRSLAWGSQGGGSTPCTTQPLSAPTSVQECCFWDFFHRVGGNWQMRRRAGQRLGQQLRVSQTGLMLGHGGLTAPRLPSKHPQPALQLDQGLSLCHLLRAWMPGQHPCQGRGH